MAVLSVHMTRQTHTDARYRAPEPELSRQATLSSDAGRFGRVRAKPVDHRAGGPE